MHHTLRRVSGWLVLLGLLWGGGLLSAQEAESIDMDALPLLEPDTTLEARFAETVTSHLYALQASAGDLLTLSMTQEADSELDPFLVLLDTSGAVLSVDDDSGDEFLSARIADYAIEEDGTYLLLASSLVYIDGTVSETDVEQGYTLTLAGNTPPDDSDETLALQAQALTYGDSVEGSSEAQAPAAFYVFEGAAGDVISAMVESSEFATVLHLFAPTGERLAVDPSAISGLELDDDGRYLLLATDPFFYEAPLLDEGFFTGGRFTLSLEGGQ